MNGTPDNATGLKPPAALAARIRRFVLRRTAVEMATGLAVVLALSGLLLLTALGMDQLLLLPAAWRYAVNALLLLPSLAWLMALPWWLRRGRAEARDLRRLDNRDDDLRATLNLVQRLQAGDPVLVPERVQETVQRASVFEALPLPSLTAERRRFWQALLCAGGAVVGLLAWRALSPDMHTGLNRYLHPSLDFGSVGVRKFPVMAEVWANVPVVPPGAGGAVAPTTPVKRTTLHFLRSRWETGAWLAAPSAPRRSVADWLAGDNPLAVARRQVTLLEGDRLDLAFQASDRREPPTLDGVVFIRYEGGRELPLRYQSVETTGRVSVGRVTRDHAFRLRTGNQFSPQYQVHVVPRPSPSQIYLFQKPPAQYGRIEKEIIVRHTAQNVNQNRLGGLPGSRLTVEFDTPYGEDLDVHESFVQLGETRRFKLKRITSRNAERQAHGTKMWTFDFVIDESYAVGAKLYFHLVTEKARFAGQPIANDYDEPLLVQAVDDFPPMVEITWLPQRRHFASDEAFAFRYRYTDDYGVAEVGLDVHANPRTSEAYYVPLGVRPPAVPGEARRDDELLQILDLSEYNYGFVDFAVVIKDVKGQVAKSGVVSLTMSDSPTEVLLPRLTGGWAWAWDHNRQNPMMHPGDLESAPAAAALDDLQGALARLRQFQDGTPLKAEVLKELVKALDYRHAPFITYHGLPFGFHHRDYPYYFHRQAASWLSGLADISSFELAASRALIAKLAAAPDPLKAPEYAQLQARRAETSALLDTVSQLQDTKCEIARRVALQRAAYFSALIGRRLAETERQMAALRQAAGDMQATQQTADLWAVYPDWVSRNKSDPEVQQKARLAAFSVRNVNRKMALLNEELNRLLAGNREGLDSRLVAVMSMLARAGRTVFGTDRTALAAKAALLERFISQGVLGAENVVYRDIAGEFPPCAKQAADASGRVEAAAAFVPAFLALHDAANALVETDLRRDMGAPAFPAGKSERWVSNQTSRVRSLLDTLMEQTRRIQRGADFAACADLSAIRAGLLELRETLAGLRDNLTFWPALAARRSLLDGTDAAAASLLTAADAMADVQRTAGVLGGFQGMFAKDGTPEVKDRALVNETGGILAELAQFERLTPSARAALEPLLKAEAALPKAPWVRVSCAGPAGESRDTVAGLLRLAVVGDRLAVQGRVLDQGPATAPADGTGTAVSVFFFPADKEGKVRQFVFRPRAAGGTGAAALLEQGQALGTVILDWYSRPLPSGGFEFLATIPLGLAGIAAEADSFRLECAYTVSPGAGAPAQVFTLFGSVPDKAAVLPERYGVMRVATGLAGLSAERQVPVAQRPAENLPELLSVALRAWWGQPPAAAAWAGAEKTVATARGANATDLERMRQLTRDQAPCCAEAARLPHVKQLLDAAGKRFLQLVALPVWGGSGERVPATQPLPGISAASSRLFDSMTPGAVLARLDADVRKAGGDPVRIDALFDTATAYFRNLPIDGAKEPVGNPVEEYLRGRIAAAFYLTSPAAITPFVQTFTRSANERKEWLLGYFTGRALPAEVKDFVAQKDYGTPALPPDIAPLAKPWFDAAANLDATFRAQRLQRLQELLTLARGAQAALNHHEALIRVHELVSGLDDLRESVGLMRYPADDIRVDNLWAEMAEQAEGLERDLLAGRLADIPAPARQALRQRVHVFRRASYAEVLKDATLYGLFRDYHAALRDLERQLLPRALELRTLFKADLPNLRRDVALVLVTLYESEFWLEQQQELESLQKRILLSGLGEEEKKRNLPPVGSMALARQLQTAAAVASYAWRGACNMATMEYAADPADARQEALLHDYAWLTVIKLLPEFFYFEVEGASAWRSYQGRYSADATALQIVKQIQVARRTGTFLIRALTAAKPFSGLPSRNAEILDWIMPFEATSVLNQNEKDLLDYQKTFRILVQGTDMQAVRDTAARFRSLRQAQGQFWRLYGDHLIDALDAGRSLLELEAGAKLDTAALQQRLKTQAAAFRLAQRHMDLLGTGLSEKEQADMVVVADAAAYAERWLAALGAPGAAAAAEYAAGYREVHEGVQSFMQSLQGNMFPPEATHAPRPVWREFMPQLDAFGRAAEMLATENRWFARADRARAAVYREFCSLARDRLTGAPVNSQAISFSFLRYEDIRSRHWMPFATKEPGAGRPPLRPQLVDVSMPEHLNQAFTNAQTIDLPDQDNRLARKLYFEALLEEKDNTRSGE